MVRASWARSNDGPPSSYVGFPASLRRSAAAAAEAKSWRVDAEILPLAAAPGISPPVRYSRKWSVTPFRIQAIAQQRELHAALAQRELAGPVISGERVSSDIGVEHARVQDAGEPDRIRRVDDIGVVDDALARLATRHQQKPGHTGRRRAHGLRLGIVRLAHL